MSYEWATRWSQLFPKITEALPNSAVGALNQAFGVGAPETVDQFFLLFNGKQSFVGQYCAENNLRRLFMALEVYSNIDVIKQAAFITRTFYPSAIPVSWDVSATATANVTVNIGAQAPAAPAAAKKAAPAVAYDPMDDDDMVRDDKNLKLLIGTYHGFSIKVTKAQYGDIKAGKAITAKVIFVKDEKNAAARSDKFFAADAEKAGGEDRVHHGYVSGAAKLWHAEIPKEVKSRGQALTDDPAPAAPAVARRGVAVTAISSTSIVSSGSAAK